MEWFLKDKKCNLKLYFKIKKKFFLCFLSGLLLFPNIFFYPLLSTSIFFSILLLLSQFYIWEY